jgi:hypothetical protein
MDDLSIAVNESRDGSLQNLFYQLYAKFQDTISYLAEYSLRLKASAAGILLGIARIHSDVADPQEQRAFMNQILNPIIHPLLTQLNQERTLSVKELACDSICDLLEMLQRMQMHGPLRKVGTLILQMAVERDGLVTQKREEGVFCLIKRLVKSYG